MSVAFPVSNPLLPNGQFSQEWRRFLLDVTGRAFGGVTSVSITPVNGISGTVTNPSTTPAIALALGNITPTSVASSGAVSGSNLTGTNTGDQTIALTGDVTGSGTGSFAATVGKIGGKAVSLAGALTTSGAFASTFTMTGVTAVTFPTAGTLATLNGAETLTQKTLTVPKLTSYTVATLPAAASSANALAMVLDSSVVASGNYGAIVAAGGANIVKVYCDGTNWRIG